MKLRRFLSCMMALLLVCSLPLTAFAAEYDLAQGSIKVEADTSGQYVTQTETGINRQEDPNPVITQTADTEIKNTVTITATENATANVTIQNVNIANSDPSGAPPVDHSGEAAVTIDVKENASANVTLDGVKIDVGGTGGNVGFNIPGEAAVQITGNGNVTLELDGENILQSGNWRAGVEKNTTAATETKPASGTGKLTITDENETHGSLEATGGECGAGIGGGSWGSGSNITITGNANVEATGGIGGSGIGGGAVGSGSDITIEGNAEVTAQGGVWAAGIGGGDGAGSGSKITITGNAEVTATGGKCGAGIGGGISGSGSDIAISGDAQVKAQGGESTVNPTNAIGAGAAIGNGGIYQYGTTDAELLKGQEVAPITDELTPNGKIEYYAPGADMENNNPTKVVTGTYVPPQPEEPVQPENPVQPAQPKEDAPQPAQPLYRVIGQDGKAISCKAEQKGGVLTITVEADFATLTGSISGLKTLKAQGVDTIVFATNGAASTFAISDLLAQGGDSYQLTHDGAAVTFTLGSGADISKILK